MPLDENSALDIAAVRALETDADARMLWTDAERAWASRAAAEVVGDRGTEEAFLAQRARLALTRAGERFKVFPSAVRYLRWRPWVGTVIVFAGFLAGVAIDIIDSGQRINVLAPPVLALLIWNFAVYALLVGGFVVRYGDATSAGPVQRAVAWLSHGWVKPRGGRQFDAAVGQLIGDWSRISAPLYSARAGRILHLAAAALAAGVLVGLYLRGIAFEYLATWESTFLTAESVRGILAIALFPGAALTGIPIPAVSELEAIRAPAGENAARWLHLMAGTVVVFVIVPRLMLALGTWAVERRRSTNLPLALHEPYFQRLLRGYRDGPVRVDVLPYSYTVPPGVKAGLECLVARAFGGGAVLTTTDPVPYGGEDALAAAAGPKYTGWVIALFNATAVPERAAHGAFLAVIGAQVGPAGTLVALVDESSFRARLGSEPSRLEERRRLWREICTDRLVPCGFADLMAPDIAEAQAELERALGETTK